MLLTNAFVYVFLAWLAGLLLSTDETEGRSLTSIFLPLFIRKYFTKVDEDAVLHGDVRQGEQMLSEKERSVRAYKVSKTFKETQALKEVSFDLQRGSVFVLLGHNGAGKPQYRFLSIFEQMW
jgi:ABC-type glutathione transport system ATPase component